METEVSEQRRGSKPKYFPYWSYSTRREFRTIKRAELKSLEKAFSKFRLEAAYFPGYPKYFDMLTQSLKGIRESVRTEWGKS